jgi:uncharacterized Zn finger protein
MSLRGFDKQSSSVPIPVANGICTRSQRGTIGTAWWTKNWLAALEAAVPRPILEAGRRYARKGQTRELSFAPGAIHAVVQGTREAAYVCELRFRQFTDDEWTVALARSSEQAATAACLLAGDVPETIENLFGEAPLPLWPSFADGDPAGSCDCHSAPSVCKHHAAAIYLTAERLDEDPLLLLTLRGRGGDTVRGYWHRHWAAPEQADTATPLRPLADRLDHYYGDDMSELLPPDEEQQVEHIDLLGQLGFPPFFPDRDDTVMPALRRLYEDS